MPQDKPYELQDKPYDVMFCSGETAKLTPEQTIQRCIKEKLIARIFERYWTRIGTIFTDGTYENFGLTIAEIEEQIAIQDGIWNLDRDSPPEVAQNLIDRQKELYKKIDQRKGKK